MLTAVEKVDARVGAKCTSEEEQGLEGRRGVGHDQRPSERTAEKQTLRGEPSSFTAQTEEIIL